MGKKKEKTSSTSTGTATTTPNVPSWIQGPAQSIYGQIGGLVNQTPSTFGPSQLQQQSWQGASGLGINSALSEAMNGTRGLMNYLPDSVQAGGSNLVNGPNRDDYTASTYGPSTVSAGLLRDTDLSSYMNPYTDSVINAAQSDFTNANDLGLNSLRSMTPNGAYGGSRQMVSAGQLVGDNTRNFAQIVAGLRQGGYQNAQSAAMSDIDRTLGADTFNAGQTQSAGAANAAAQNAMRAGLLGDEQATRFANQSAQEAASGRSLTAQQFNANAGLQAAQFRGNMASQLGQQGAMQDGNSRANLTLQAGFGDQQRAIAQENDPQNARIRQLQQLAQIMGIDPSQFIGQQITSSGQQTGQSSSSDPWGWLGTALGGVGTLWGRG